MVIQQEAKDNFGFDWQDIASNNNWHHYDRCDHDDCNRDGYSSVFDAVLDDEEGAVHALRDRHERRHAVGYYADWCPYCQLADITTATTT
jgi:hypothetical protein